MMFFAARVNFFVCLCQLATWPGYNADYEARAPYHYLDLAGAYSCRRDHLSARNPTSDFSLAASEWGGDTSSEPAAFGVFKEDGCKFRKRAIAHSTITAWRVYLG